MLKLSVATCATQIVHAAEGPVNGARGVPVKARSSSGLRRKMAPFPLQFTSNRLSPVVNLPGEIFQSRVAVFPITPFWRLEGFCGPAHKAPSISFACRSVTRRRLEDGAHQPCVGPLAGIPVATRRTVCDPRVFADAPLVDRGRALGPTTMG